MSGLLDIPGLIAVAVPRGGEFPEHVGGQEGGSRPHTAGRPALRSERVRSLWAIIWLAHSGRREAADSVAPLVAADRRGARLLNTPGRRPRVRPPRAPIPLCVLSACSTSGTDGAPGRAAACRQPEAHTPALRGRFAAPRVPYSTRTARHYMPRNCRTSREVDGPNGLEGRPFGPSSAVGAHPF
jgi:hypothetical protein